MNSFQIQFNEICIGRDRVIVKRIGCRAILLQQLLTVYVPQDPARLGNSIVMPVV